MRLGFTVGLIFLMPAFVIQLAFDPVNFQFTGSRILQAANLFCTVYGIGMILASRQARDIVLRCRPAFLLVGIAFSSCLWSFDPASTFRASYLFLTTSLFGLALASRLSPSTSLQVILRALVLACVLSIIWVILFPQQAVHQATDRIQFQHAGLWRGIFSHKQGLGVISGLTTGLLLFYGSAAFSSRAVRIAAIACTVTCLIGSGSVTGLLVAAIMAAMLYVTHAIALRLPQARRGAMAMLAVALGLLYCAFHFGVLDFVMPLLGKSADLTGRADEWPWVIANIKNSGSALLGGGFASGWEDVWAPTISIDNGYIEMLGCFGYLGTAIVISVYVWVIGAGVKAIFSSSRDAAKIEILPFNIMFIELFMNITEASFMTKSINTILICVAICHVIRHRDADGARAAGLRYWQHSRPGARDLTRREMLRC